MNSALKTVFLFTLILFIAQAATGQSFLDRVKKKANQKIEERLEKKLDKTMDKQLDKLENSIDSLGNGGATSDTPEQREHMLQKRMSTMMKGMGMTGEPVPVEDSYTFTELVQMHLEMYDNSEQKTSHGEFITHLNPNSQSLAYEVVSNDIGDTEQGLFIIDSKNKAIILLNDRDREKTGIVYGMGTFFEDLGEPEGEEEIPDNVFASPYLTKTGKTKNIAGYKCEQYLYNTDETESEFWITDALKTGSHDFFRSLFKTSAYTNGMGRGYVMESHTKDKVSGDKSTMKVTKVDKNSVKNFNLSAYQITNLGTFNMPSGTEE